MTDLHIDLAIKTCKTMIHALEDTIDFLQQELVDIVFIFTPQAKARKLELSDQIAQYRVTLGKYEKRLEALQAG